MAIDLTLLGLITALAYYLANARLTLHGWLLTKDLKKASEIELWRQIEWISKFLWATIVSGLLEFVTFLARFNNVPEQIADLLRIGSLLPLALVVLGLIFFHASIAEKIRKKAEEKHKAAKQLEKLPVE
jgi:hypothetical protein